MFIDDLEKVNDLLSISKDEFLKFYSYITENEYDETLKEATNLDTLCNLYRQGENLHIEDMNGRDTGLSITGDNLKETVANYVNANIHDLESIETFRDFLYSTGC